MARYYLDTCIWIDYFEDRSDRFRPLGYWAFCLIRNIVRDKDIIIYSDTVEKELRSYDKDPASVFSMVPAGSLFKAAISDEQLSEAGNLSREFNIPPDDCVHFILARDNDAVLVTRDKHFYSLTGKVDIRKPEELV